MVEKSYIYRLTIGKITQRPAHFRNTYETRAQVTRLQLVLVKQAQLRRSIDDGRNLLRFYGYYCLRVQPIVPGGSRA